MKVLLVSHGSGPYGAERVLLALAHGLATRGHEVVVEFPQPGPAWETARQDETVQCRLGTRHRLPRNAWEAVGYFAAAIPSVMDARRTIREVEPDLIWLNSLYNPWAAIAAGLSRRPVVWHLHEYRLPEPLGLAVAPLIGAVAARVAVVSGFLADGWARYPWLRRRTSVLANPLLDELDPVAEPPEPFTVGYLGQLEPRKRVPDLIQAIAHLPDVRGVIVGDGKARGDAESAIRERGVGDRVELAGFRADVRAQLARFHCMAIPSLREPFGLVALEAMAAGVPVVAARSGALPEVLGSAALYHTPGNADSLAAQIRLLEADRALRRELVERGLRRVKVFRKDAWLDRVEQIARLALRASEETS